MDQVIIDIPGLDWTDIRQGLSMALLESRPVKIVGAGAFLEKNQAWLPLYRDLESFIASQGAGDLSSQSGDLVFNPGCLDGWRMEIETGKFSSAVEMVLFLMPVLFYRRSRTVVLSRGVTHSPWSVPTTFMKETFLDILEGTGHYGSVLLQRFGFYGCGGGSLEAKVYPAEAHPMKVLPSGAGTIKGVRIFIAGINMELAKREKERLCRDLDLEEGRISIIDVRDAAGFGNSVQVIVEKNGLPLIITAEMHIYNHAGDFIFDEEAFNESLDSLVKESLDMKGEGVYPERLTREICPYLVLSGSEIPAFLEKGKAASTLSLCRSLISRRPGQGDR